MKSQLVPHGEKATRAYAGQGPESDRDGGAGGHLGAFREEPSRTGRLSWTRTPSDYLVSE